MAETVAASTIIPEVLNKDNYEDWRVRLQTYLKAQGLWDVIEANDRAFKKGKSEAEKKKDAIALHTIYNSCGTDAFKTIREIESAKSAWETLKTKFRPPVVKESSNNSDNNFQYQSFFDAVEKNNLSIAQTFLSDPEAVKSRHPVSGQTALHIAAYEGHEQMVKELVQVMGEEDQEIQDTQGYTALLAAVRGGKTSIAKCMANKNPKILSIPYNGTRLLPVSSAFVDGNINLAKYLYSITPQEYLLAEEGVLGAELLVTSIQAEQYDIALDLLRKCPGLTISKFMLENDLEDMPVQFSTASRLNFWQQWIYRRINLQSMVLATGNICVDVSNSEDRQSTRSHITCSGLLKQFASNARKLLGLFSATLKTLLGIQHLYKMKLGNACASEVLDRICEEIKNHEQLEADTSITNSIIHAISMGEFEFVARLANANPRLVGMRDKETGRIMIMIAVQYRREKIVSFFMEQNFIHVVDKYGNSLLHMTGLVPPPSDLNILAGPALQMQNELQWFQEVESFIENKILKSVHNDEGMTAREYFTKNHEELRKRGEKWMKETASSYSFVAALIVTITFAAGFIVPGGGDDMRSLSHKKWFLVFIISDAASLFSSTTSVLIFLGILTSHYDEEAFLTSLPTKLILGMSTLFFSIATMLLCFCAALYEMLQGHLGILIPIILLASIPIYLFISLQFPLLVDIIISTYGPGLRIAPKKDKKRWFFW